ncbi:hypothetical protein FGO68_gene1293 [Halteria grandinella]|uniref:Uncharacterized protein n=1 Tax=Halteria grandinella TaxID=5974 RepID=A0A8J8NUN1_HALGN|nr:hypothetical protein FGO68_gene1293 [Halteria grandinella]
MWQILIICRLKKQVFYVQLAQKLQIQTFFKEDREIPGSVKSDAQEFDLQQLILSLRTELVVGHHFWIEQVFLPIKSLLIICYAPNFQALKVHKIFDYLHKPKLRFTVSLVRYNN